jgi:uncharacterized protein YbjT (DUF2867 family)
MILVTGATGNVGRHVVRQLVEAGERVRAVTRDPARAELPDGADVVRGDLLDPSTYGAMFAGVTRVHLLAAGEGVAEFVTAARDAGVERIVLLSSLAGGGAIGAHHRGLEAAVERSGVAWTHLRPGAFMANVRWQWAASIRAEGVVRTPYPGASLAPIHEADIAAVATEALLREDHANTAYELTGPESLTYAEQAAVLGKAIGREIDVVELTPEQAREQMTRAMPAAVADTLLEYWAERVGTRALVSPCVEQVTGRPARNFAQWAAEHAAEFR